MVVLSVLPGPHTQPARALQPQTHLKGRGPCGEGLASSHSRSVQLESALPLPERGGTGSEAQAACLLGVLTLPSVSDCLGGLEGAGEARRTLVCCWSVA